MAGLTQDIRHGVRMLARARGFTAILVAVIALGVGANTAIFSAVHSLLLRPLPFADSARLVALYEKRPRTGRERNVVSAPDFADWRAQAKSFDRMAAWIAWTFTLRFEEPEVVHGALVSGDFFATLGARPALGRIITPADERLESNLVCVISDSLWRRRFQADAAVIGKLLPGMATAVTIVGVMPRDFRYPVRESEVWVPVDMMKFDANRASHGLSVIARLRPGVTLAAAQQEMTAISLELEKAHRSNAGHYSNVFGLHDEQVREIRNPLWILVAAVGFVLLIACANAANLLLARGAARRREIAIRASIGASQWRVMRQLLVESILLSLLGGGFGMLIATWGAEALGLLMPKFAPAAVGEISIDGWVLGFSLALSLITGVVVGVLPAAGAAHLRPVAALQEQGRTATESRGGRRLRSALVVAEVAIALVLVAGAGLLIASFVRLNQVNPGFRVGGLLTTQVSLPPGKYPAAKLVAFWQTLSGRLRATPGVRAAGGISFLPLSGQDSGRNFGLENRPPATHQEQYNAGPRWVTPDYFETMGIPLLRGRFFSWSDTPDQPLVFVINDAFARKYFPGEDPIGKRVNSGGGHWRPIVGVVGDVRHVSLGGEVKPELYFPVTQEPYGRMNLVVRVGGDPVEQMATVRGAIRAVEKDAVVTLRTMDEVVAESLAKPRVFLSLTSVFAGLALLLAALGLFGVVSYSVAQRTQEMGIRIALGARPRDLVRMVVLRSLGLVAGGIAIGLPAALGLTRYLGSLLYGVEPTDALTLSVVCAVMLGAGLLASAIPARRVTQVAPSIALRPE